MVCHLPSQAALDFELMALGKIKKHKSIVGLDSLHCNIIRQNISNPSFMTK